MKTMLTDDVDYINRKGSWWKINEDTVYGHKQIHKMLMQTENYIKNSWIPIDE